MERTSLRDLGLVFQLGHGGFECPAPRPAPPRKMVVLDMAGVYEVKVLFCGCGAAGTAEDWQQCYRTGWYPATTGRPLTCATLEVLNFYRQLKVYTNCNVRDFLTVLETESNPLGTSPPPPRYDVCSSPNFVDTLADN